ncbi:MAG: HEAT repeat domain-containing protein [Chloroflexi bacterium]|nr:HEAT repeat domain-containing protein [Chloroflexota bacterium]
MGIFDMLSKPNVEKVEKMEAKKDVKGLIKLLTYEDRDVRKAVTYALGEIGDAQAVEGLKQALKHEDWQLRWYAAEALKRIASKKSWND